MCGDTSINPCIKAEKFSEGDEIGCGLSARESTVDHRATPQVIDPISGFVVVVLPVPAPSAGLRRSLRTTAPTTTRRVTTTTTTRQRAPPRRNSPARLFVGQQQQQKRPSSSSSNTSSGNRGHKRKTQQQQQKKRRQSSSRVVGASYTIQNEVPRKRDRNQLQKNQPTTRSSRVQDTTASASSSSFLWRRLPAPGPAAQLGLARDGHAVLRQWLRPTGAVLGGLRPALERHCRRRELGAWRQKVEVAADVGGGASSPERAQRRAASCQTVADCRMELRRLLGNDDDADLPLPFLQFFNTWRTVPPAEQLARALAEPAAALLDVPAVRLYQDAVFWKRAADGPTPWHADARLAPFDTSRMVTFWIPLQPRVAASGLVFCSRSHSDFALPFWNDRPRNDADDDTNDGDSPWLHLEERYGGDAALVDYMPLQVGDVTVHAGWTLHCADALPQGHGDRWALAVTFVDARAPVRRDALTCPKGDREDAWSYRDWVPEVVANTATAAGHRSGLWDHPLVPIVWPPSALASSGKQKN